jgi:hypothetical protein
MQAPPEHQLAKVLVFGQQDGLTCVGRLQDAFIRGGRIHLKLGTDLDACLVERTHQLALHARIGMEPHSAAIALALRFGKGFI